MSGPLLAVSGLTIDIGDRRVVDGLRLDLAAGEVTALVGRSGSGKSLTAGALVGLRPEGAALSGRALLDTGDGPPEDLLAPPRHRGRAPRGARAGYVFQESQASLNPTVTVGRHLLETLRAHGVPRALRRATGLAELSRAGLEQPERIWAGYPFELSGGQAQRVALALARAPGPRLLIADEITSALDPVTQAEVLDGLRADAVAHGRALLLITHDLAVAGRWADRVAVLGAGRIVESGPAADVLGSPADPFTADLVRASGATAGGRV
ncbi:ABC-type glutathione transport system ATPase component [Spinactinospora alkalitolerans]|uniref:ABC-type glutathione transport system ATPase component n=1 Tax=Spinactinospora alkalitolerans TaxID=687207 RepID=A0A852TMA3_9ACTN|nr:ABC transporter ATP-binding protein [Spinactinospora alkalitolerans]NYE45068.1 ABC-type glutathione transport system ATPase component [Spinactinospora alkalitolerans]